MHPLANSLIGTTAAPGVQIQARPGEGAQGFAELASGLSQQGDGVPGTLQELVSAAPFTGVGAEAETATALEPAAVDAVGGELALSSPLSPSPQPLPATVELERPPADGSAQAPLIGDLAAVSTPIGTVATTVVVNPDVSDGRPPVAVAPVEMVPPALGVPKPAGQMLSQSIAQPQGGQATTEGAMAATVVSQAAPQLAVGPQTRGGDRTAIHSASPPVTSLQSAQATAPLRAWNPMTLAAVVDAGPVTAHTPVAESPEGVRPLEGIGMQAQARGSQWGPLPLDAAGGSEQLGRQMLAPLKEQIRFSLEHRITKAEVRLDPPELGRIDLSVRQEGDRITVQLHAANPAVREALASGAERLRSDMAQAMSGEVQVDVGQGAPGERQQPRHPETEGQVIASHHSTVTTADTERDLIDMLA